MIKTRASIIGTVILLLSAAGLLLPSCGGKTKEGMIIITIQARNISEIKNSIESLINSAPRQILMLNPVDGTTKVLTADYYSAMSPSVSFDGNFLLFIAKDMEKNPWQISEMNLSNLKTRQVLSVPDDCTDPVYLPNGRISFSKSDNKDKLSKGRSLYTCNSDGSDIKKITFNPNDYRESYMLKDGRILTVTNQIYPLNGKSTLIALRPDGTKAELFYGGDKNRFLMSGGKETSDGKVVFIEADKESQLRNTIVTVNYNSPLHTRVNLTPELHGDFRSVIPLQSGKYLVSYQPDDSDKYALYEFDPEKKSLGNLIYSDTENDILEAVVVQKHERPKKLPSEVDMGVKTGLLLCQDINYSDKHSQMISASFQISSRIEIIGIDSTLGTVQVEEDGSVYLKVIADTPFRIQTIDDKGKVISGPCEWIWLRPNERRGCVGCHENPEMTPFNRVPMSVKKSPVNIPIHINKVVEKKISLE
jgi:hypothetical protein